MIDWSRLKEALRAIRRHLTAGEIEQSLQALDLAEDCVAPLEQQERAEVFDIEFENHR